ncbi:MAG: ATP phosphoribosyltransferase [Oscillospiraceae bacterium]|nr:ATP phosphoribosyltransferase [Oscillospiraceae bacterium]
MIRLALTKGRIEEKAIEILTKAGYDCSELAEENKGRKLFFKILNTDIEIVLAKANDVITYIEHGVCDAGIVGADTIMENAKSLYEILDLKFGKCKFSLAGPVGQNFINNYTHKIVASKYPNVTKEYFNQRNMDVEIVKIDGSVELAPLLGLADAIVDLVETGATLKANGLEIYDDIAQISARLAVNIASIKLKKREIDEFIKNISEVI